MNRKSRNLLGVATVVAFFGIPLFALAEEPAEQAQRLDKAIAAYTEVLKDNPYSAEAFLRRGVAYRNKKDYAAALMDYDKAIAIDPSQPGGFNAKGWLLATCGDDKFLNPPMALELALTANRLSPQPNIDYLDTLAASQAANGNFSAAMETIKQAIDLAEKGKMPEGVADLQKRLASYTAGKPWRQ